MNKLGIYNDGCHVLSYQIGDGSLSELISNSRKADNDAVTTLLGVDGLRVLPRGNLNSLPDEIELNLKKHRLMPSVIDKQVKLLMGDGLGTYRLDYSDGKPVRKWEENATVRKWLNSWLSVGFSDDAEDLMLSIITSYYYHGDYFCKWRFSRGRQYGSLPVAAMELVSNRKVRLATTFDNGPSIDDYDYSDFNRVAVGNWRSARGGYKIYPLLHISEINQYRHAAISHHANIDPSGMYGINRSYEGSKGWLLLSNDNAKYINSFLSNALAARLHIIIPAEWVENRRKKIQQVCDENLSRSLKGEPMIEYMGINIGDTFSEQYVNEIVTAELRKLSDYLSGPAGQGKAFSSFSFRDGDGRSIEWQILPIDLKYQEYINSLITVDRRSDEVVASSVGIDPSITNISKDGMISKSGSDAYYNYMIYLSSLSTEEKICTDAYNMALRVNFPELYADGTRIGLYRSVVEKQQDISPSNRMTNGY